MIFIFSILQANPKTLNFYNNGKKNIEFGGIFIDFKVKSFGYYIIFRVIFWWKIFYAEAINFLVDGELFWNSP